MSESYSFLHAMLAYDECTPIKMEILNAAVTDIMLTGSGEVLL